MERKRNLKRRLMALLMALLIISGSVIPTAYDLVSLAEGQESETDESSAGVESSEAPEESTAAPAGQVSAQNETGADVGPASISLSAKMLSKEDEERQYVVSGEDVWLEISFTVPPLESGGV